MPTRGIVKYLHWLQWSEGCSDQCYRLPSLLLIRSHWLHLWCSPSADDSQPGRGYTRRLMSLCSISCVSSEIEHHQLTFSVSVWVSVCVFKLSVRSVFFPLSLYVKECRESPFSQPPANIILWLPSPVTLDFDFFGLDQFLLLFCHFDRLMEAKAKWPIFASMSYFIKCTPLQVLVFEGKINMTVTDV